MRPVNKRAWCFQERILATRVLHSCNGVVLFECNTDQSSSSHGYRQEYPKKPYLAADGKLQVLIGPKLPPRLPFLTVSFPQFKFNGELSPGSMKFFKTITRRGPRVPYPTRPFSQGTIQTYETTTHFNPKVSLPSLPSLPTLNLIEHVTKTYTSYNKFFSWRPQQKVGAPRSA